MTTFEQFIESIRKEGNDGRAFEVFSKWFLENDPQWSTQVDKVWLWDDYPNRWGRDCGVDLVFLHKDGSHWAVQAKCYAPRYSVTKADIDKFLSETNRSEIHGRLLLATTDMLGANARRVCKAQEKPVTRYLLSDFLSASVEYPGSISELTKKAPKPKPKPRRHQIEAIEAVAGGLSENDRGQLIMACGTGKTFTTLWIMERMKAETTLVLLPSLNLLSQTLREWTAACNYSFEALCVCSDDSVGRPSEDITTAEFGFPVTSEAMAIRAFLKRGGPKVVFCTYQSSARVADAQMDADTPVFDLVVADEAHRCAGNKAGEFATVLDGERIRAAKRLFTTATPRIYATHLAKRAGDRGIEIVGMDDVAIFGPELHRLTFGEAISRDLLTDYRVVIIGVDEPMIAEWIEERELLQVDPDKVSDARTLAAKVGLIKAIRDYDLQRVISFHSRVEGAREFSEEVGQVVDLVAENQRPDGDLWSDYVSGAMPTGDRVQKIKRLKTLEGFDRGLLANARCLSEGVDVPALDGIAFIDPRASQVDIIQAVGRAIRLSENKEVGTIVLPVFIESGDDAAEAIENSDFKPVWEVLKALRAHDEVLADALDQYRLRMGKRAARTGSLPKLEFDLPTNLDPSFSDALETLIVEQTTESWEFWFGLLETYVEREGHARVPHSHQENGYKLGSWVREQRTTASKMSAKRYSRLEGVDGWVWNVPEWQWSRAVDHLRVFAENEGHARVPSGYVDPEGFKLGQWLGSVRQRKTSLSTEKIQELEAIQGWAWDPHALAWGEAYNRLLQFANNMGGAMVPDDYESEDGFKLGAWVVAQRMKMKRSSLSDERIAQLEAISGWSWSALESRWEEGFNELSKFVASNGSAQVPAKYVSKSGFRLGGWVREQRGKWDTLSSDRQTRLEAMDGWLWKPQQELWEIGFKELSAFVRVTGHALPPAKYITENGYKLGRWVVQQRRNKDRLTDEQVLLLESLNGWLWDVLETKWQESCNALKRYVEQEGHARPPYNYVDQDGYRVGRWVNKQRANKDKLSDERQSQLEALTGWVWSARAVNK